MVLWRTVQGSRFIEIKNAVTSCLSVEYYGNTYYNYYFKVRNFFVAVEKGYVLLNRLDR